MIAFEYRREIVPATDTPEEAVERLNEFGAEGWQVIAMSPPVLEGVLLWMVRAYERHPRQQGNIVHRSVTAMVGGKVKRIVG